MRNAIKLVMLGGLLSVLLGSLAACGTVTGAAPTSAAPVSLTPASDFKVEKLVINPSEVNAGVETLISATVTNTGNQETIYAGNLRVDSLTRKSLPTYLGYGEVNIPPGATQLVSVLTTINNPGTYKVTWGDASQTLLVNPAEKTQTAGSQPSAPGTAADFTAQDVVTGEPVSLKEYAGKAVLLNLVNYGCNPSINDRVSAQLMAIKELQQKRDDFVPISVFCGCCPPDVLRQFAQENNFKWPWILDTDYSIAAKYSQYLKRYGYPTLVFINPDQTISEVTGYINPAALNDKLNKLTLRGVSS